jgi:hypothetical protein
MLPGGEEVGLCRHRPGSGRALSACRRIRIPDLTCPGHAGPTIRGLAVDAAGYGAGAWSLLIMDAFELTDDVRANRLLVTRNPTPVR